MGDAVDTTMKHVLRVCATVAVLVTAGAASTTGRGTEAPGTGGPVPAEFPPVIAALLTSRTSVEQDSATSLRYVQSIDGGDRRNVSVVLTPVRSYQPPPQTVPMKLDNGAAIYAQSVKLSTSSSGYTARLSYFIPATSLTLEQQASLGLAVIRPSLLDRLLGIGVAIATGELVGVQVEMLDSLGTEGTVATPGAGVRTVDEGYMEARAAHDALEAKGLAKADSVVSGSPKITPQEVESVAGSKVNLQQHFEDVEKMFEHSQLQNERRVFEAAERLQKQLAEKRAAKELARNVAKSAADVGHVAMTAYEISQIVEKYRRRQAYLDALRKCAENPTSPTAKKAQHDDPRYRQATTGAIDDAARNLAVNAAMQLVSSTGNSIAATLLGHKAGVPMAMLSAAEAHLLDHVADDYIMKDAGKGVVPCTPGCDDDLGNPASSPPVSGASLASQGTLTCDQPAPGVLTCGPGPAYTTGPARKVSGPGPTCGPLKHADFSYSYRRTSSACNVTGCGDQSKRVSYAASAALRAVGSEGYDGQGAGSYHEFSVEQSRFPKVPAPCNWSHHHSSTDGRASMAVHARNTIDNDVTGGYDTSDMPDDTSVVEILISRSYGSVDYHADCDGDKSTSNPPEPPGDGTDFDCHFYGVDLRKPGFYKAFKDGEPEAGVCTLTLSR